METPLIPLSINPTMDLDYALDDYVKGLEGSCRVLESIDKMTKVLLSSPETELTFETFQVIQLHIHSSQRYLGVPHHHQVSLEYYNNRPLRELALESLGSFFDKLIEFIKKTFQYIIDCIKAIFGVASTERLKSENEKVEDTKKRVDEALAVVTKRKEENGKAGYIVEIPEVAKLGITDELLTSKHLIDRYMTVIQASKEVLEASNKLHEKFIKLEPLIDSYHDRKEDPSWIQELHDIERGVSNSFLGCKELPGEYTSHDPHDLGKETVGIIALLHMHAFCIQQEGEETPWSAVYKEYKLKADNVTQTVDIFDVLSSDSKHRSLREDAVKVQTSLNESMTKFSGKSKELGNKMTKLLESIKPTSESSESEGSGYTPFKTIQAAAAGLASHTKFIAVLIQALEGSRVLLNNISFNKKLYPKDTL